MEFTFTSAELSTFTANAVSRYMGLVQICPSEEIDTPLRFCHFLAQCAHETRGFTRLRESFDYTPAALMATFGHHLTQAQADALGRQEGEAFVPLERQQGIANLVYADRFGNGDVGSGDGWRYCGRGDLQITFKDNYAAMAEELGVDLVATPELLESPSQAIKAAGVFWRLHGCNAAADADDLQKVRGIINPAFVGLSDCAVRLMKAKGVWMRETGETP